MLPHQTGRSRATVLHAMSLSAGTVCQWTRKEHSKGSKDRSSSPVLEQTAKGDCERFIRGDIQVSS